MSLDLTFLRLVWPTILHGAINTLQLSLAVLIVSTVCGMLIALGLHSRWRRLRSVLAVGSWVTRGIPPLMLLLIVFLGFPRIGLQLAPFSAATVGLSAYISFYFAEVFAAGLSSIPHSQYQAALALALPRFRTFRRIVLPQMIPSVVPSYCSRVTEIVEGTSISAAVAFQDLATVSKQVIATTFRPIETLLIISVIYVVINTLVLSLQTFAERHVAWQGRRR